jgi:hypothetical protein
VLTPWTGPRTTTFRGALGPSATRRSFRIRLHLDGAARFRLHGPARANYDLRISSGAGSLTTTHAAGSRDRVGSPAICRVASADTVTITVLRRTGSGPFTLTTRYAG